MNEDKTNNDSAPAIDQLQDAYTTARERVREANSALADFAGLLREVVKEDKQRRNEIRQVRAGLSKLQAIHV